MTRFVVSPLQQSTELPDLLIASVGYESRSSYVFAHRAARAVAVFPYPDQGSDVFTENIVLARALPNATLFDCPTLPVFEASFAALLNTLSARPKVSLDVSSFDRRRLGVMLDLLQQAAPRLRGIDLDLLYAPAEFLAPIVEELSTPLQAGPVTDAYRGRMRRSAIPLAAVLGLGYEPQRAIGAFELLEPSQAWAFVPDSDDDRYAEALDAANRLLLSAFGEREVLNYPVLDPATMYLRLESLVTSLSREARVVLVPMGPKIFAVACLLLGLASSDDRPAVWRIGTSGFPNEVDVKARGPIVGLSVRFE